MDLSEDYSESADTLAFILCAYRHPDRGLELSEVVDAIRDTAVQGLYDYVDERIDGRNAVIALLLKYKHRCEWFRRGRFRAMSENSIEGRKGEAALAFDLYEYLHDQGVDFWVESKSAVLSIKGDGPMTIFGKWTHVGIIEAYICRKCGFTEMYTRDADSIPLSDTVRLLEAEPSKSYR